MENWSVYIHIVPNGKVYVGITSKDPKYRWNYGHGYRKCKRFWNAIVKYGWQNIKHDVLYDGLTKYEAESIERKLIADYCSTNPKYGYNIMPGGDVTQGFQAWNKGLPKEQSHLYGKPKPLEVRKKIAKTLSKPVECVELKLVFESVQSASKSLNIHSSNISRCLHGRGHTAGGHHWRWV